MDKVNFGQLGDSNDASTTVDFASVKKGNKKTRESETNTEEISYKSGGVQTTNRSTKDTQTTFLSGEDGDKSWDSMLGQEMSISEHTIRTVEIALENNLKSTTLASFVPEWYLQDSGVVTWHTFSLAQPSSSSADAPASAKQQPADDAADPFSASKTSLDIPVSGLAWNCRGNLLAVAFGRMNIQGTDTVSSRVAVWNLQRAFIKSNRPDEYLETSASVMSVAFHPIVPGILLAGTFSGELLAWNFGAEEGAERAISIVLASSLHREAITQITFSYDPLQDDYKALTVSSEGTLAMWQFKKPDNALIFPLAVWNMVPASPAASIGTVHAHKSQKKKPLGLTCLDVERVVAEGGGNRWRDRGVFMVGSEAGGVFKCFLDYSKVRTKVKGSDWEDKVLRSADKDPDGPPLTPPQLECPITYSYVPHGGAVHGLSCSSLMRNVFASCGADGIIRVHNSLQASERIALEPSSSHIYSVAWSPAKTLVMAAGGGDGWVYLYDLAVNKTTPVNRLEMPNRRPVASLAFGPQGDVLAAGDWVGSVRVWKLDKKLTEAHVRDQEAAASMSYAGDEQ